MKPNLFLKYIQYLRNRKNNDEGFTLIELLVVVLIIGVLAATALPNLLGQIGKAREVELSNCVGTITRSQQGYHFEKQIFAPSVTVLGVTCAQQYITNSTGLVTAGSVSATDVQPENSDASNDGTRAYSGRVAYSAGNYQLIICRSNGVASQLAAPTGTVGALACPANSDQIK